MYHKSKQQACHFSGIVPEINGIDNNNADNFVKIQAHFTFLNVRL